MTNSENYYCYKYLKYKNKYLKTKDSRVINLQRGSGGLH